MMVTKKLMDVTLILLYFLITINRWIYRSNDIYYSIIKKGFCSDEGERKQGSLLAFRLEDRLYF